MCGLDLTTEAEHPFRRPTGGLKYSHHTNETHTKLAQNTTKPLTGTSSRKHHCTVAHCTTTYSSLTITTLIFSLNHKGIYPQTLKQKPFKKFLSKVIQQGKIFMSIMASRGGTHTIITNCIVLYYI